MNEYINLSLENIDDGHVFRKLNARGKIFIEYEPIEKAWVPVCGKNYTYIYCSLYF